MIVAALDIGSNSIRLLIAKMTAEGVQEIQRYKEKVALGAGLDADNNLSKPAIQRGLACLTQFVKHLNQFQVTKIYCVATNAIRLANNRREFIQQAEQILMHPIQVISGQTEAELIWGGVMVERANQETGLVIDIGGGSTEFAKKKPDSLQPQTWSVQMGCVSYNQRFFTDGKIYAENMQAAITAARLAIEPLAKEIISHKISPTIGTAGTLESISLLCREVYPKDNGIIFYTKLDELIKRLTLHGETSKLPYRCLDENRKQILPAGLCICKSIMELLGIKELTMAASELCEGVLVHNLAQSLAINQSRTSAV